MAPPVGEVMVSVRSKADAVPASPIVKNLTPADYANQDAITDLFVPASGPEQEQSDKHYREA